MILLFLIRTRCSTANMVNSCCAVDCTNRFKKGISIGFFRFPTKPSRKEMWVNAVRRENWAPSKTSVICGAHFQTGRPSKDENHPDYIPNVFTFTKHKKNTAELYQKRKQRVECKTSEPAGKRSKKENIATEALLSLRNGSLAQVSDDVSARENVCSDLTLHQIEKRISKLEEELNDWKKLKADKENKKCDSTSQNLEMVALCRENKYLKSQLDASDFTSKIFKNVKLLKYYTGINSVEGFNSLIQICSDYLEKNFRVDHKTQLLLTLIKLRLNLENSDLAFRFDLSIPSVGRIIHCWLPVLAGRLQHLIKFPRREDIYDCLPDSFKQSVYKDTICIIDCTEIMTQRPPNMFNKSLMWSNYKHHQTLKFLLGIVPTGQICFVSECWGGRVSDKELTLKSGIMDKLKPGDVIMADRGFNVADHFAMHGIKLVLPAFTRGKTQLTQREVLKSKRISNVRIHVERVLASIKTFKILKGIMPITLLKYVNCIVTICAALINLSPPIL